ncbi:formate dehydrogenase accessory sulfurtransferase FdhD [Paludifilum halophilum]|uniref:Sulfur carrier protein FdhD n=1 Tax=Paludifilum halophilum TaxID=1642702 RepID=A0A235B3F3_9BACL|nr:formate dehydrogenase accessory sulfurtransferase FdhD [Paludifilum halophilum]OYD06771.1 sulfurtransferase FdhD [Paludifilum halophilum]
MEPFIRKRTSKRRVQQVRSHSIRIRQDALAVEEPMEIRLSFPELDEPFPVAVTMRTPGNDFELAAGFLLTEGILSSADEVHSITYCRDPQTDGRQQYNIVNIRLRPGISVDRNRLQRHFFTNSSCGVCGKASLDAIRIQGIHPVSGDLLIRPSVIHGLGDALRREQDIFDQTGGLHAAGWFDPSGTLIALREDVGRHNAVDKLLGHAFLEKKTPLSDAILMVSGRTSFEIMQKAAVAGIPVVCAVSAPTSLACDTAREFNITLIGFARGERYNIYTGRHRIDNG